MELSYCGSGKVFYDANSYQCNLYTNNEYGGILVKIIVNNPVASFLEFPVEIEFLSGELSTGFKFSLINCFRDNTTGLMSEGITEFSYVAQYMLQGVGGKDCQNIKFYKVIFELSDIIWWGNISGYTIDERHKLSRNENCEMVLFSNNNFTIKYVVHRSLMPVVLDEILKENITLKQKGNIEIIFKDEHTIEEYNAIIEKIIKLIELSILKKVYLTNINAFSKDVYFMVDDKKIEQTVNIINSRFNVKRDTENEKSKKWKWVTLPELIENNSFEYYFNIYEKIEPIIELYIEIIESYKISNIGVFLNITQALETYHSRFKAIGIEDFKKRIDEIILKNRPKECIEKDRKFLLANSKSFVTLESRIADLLIADWDIIFDTGNIDFLDFPNVIAKTRNYYTHYDENIKDKFKVLTKEEITIYNRTLMYILEYYLLKELGFLDIEKMKQKLNERWGQISITLSVIDASKNLKK